MRPKAIAEYKKFGGMWYVVHSDRELFSRQVSEHFLTEHEAESAKERLSDKYPPDQLFVIQKRTLAKAQANWRENREEGKLNVTFYRLTYKVPCAGNTSKYRPILKEFFSRFKAVRALRRARRDYPDACLDICTTYYHKDRQEGRNMRLRRIIR